MNRFFLSKVYNTFFLNEGIIQQNNFLESLEEICFEDIRLLEINVGNKQEFIEYLNKGFSEISGDDIELRRKDFYVSYMDELEARENKRKKSIEANNRRGIESSVELLQPIKFDRALFRKEFDFIEKMGKKEVNILVELLKCQHVIRNSGLEISKKKKEELIIHQCNKHKNIDGTSIEIRRILPLYDSILKYYRDSSEVSIIDCIKVADLYCKRFYNNISDEEKREVDLGNFNFNSIFDRFSFYNSYYEKFLSRYDRFIEGENYINLFENDNVCVYLPFTAIDFNKTIKYFKGSVNWCTQKIYTWREYNSSVLLCVLYNKKVKVGHADYLVSFKVTRKNELEDYFSVDYDECCDYRNKHMDKERINNLISDIEIDELLMTIVNNEDIINEKMSNSISLEEFNYNINNLINTNSANEIFNFILNNNVKDIVDANSFILNVFNMFNNAAGGFNNDLFCEVMSEYVCNGLVNIPQDSFLICFNGIDDSIVVKTINLVIKKSLLRNSDFKYSNSLIMLKYLDFVEFDKEVFYKIVSNAFNKTNNNEFLYEMLSSIVDFSDCIKSNFDIKSLILSEEFFNVIKDTRLFNSIFDNDVADNLTFTINSTHIDGIYTGYSLMNFYYFKYISVFKEKIEEKSPDIFGDYFLNEDNARNQYIQIFFIECDIMYNSSINNRTLESSNINIDNYKFLGVNETIFLSLKKTCFNNPLIVNENNFKVLRRCSSISKSYVFILLKIVLDYLNDYTRYSIIDNYKDLASNVQSYSRVYSSTFHDVIVNNFTGNDFINLLNYFGFQNSISKNKMSIIASKFTANENIFKHTFNMNKEMLTYVINYLFEGNDRNEFFMKIFKVVCDFSDKKCIDLFLSCLKIETLECMIENIFNVDKNTDFKYSQKGASNSLYLYIYLLKYVFNQNKRGYFNEILNKNVIFNFIFWVIMRYKPGMISVDNIDEIAAFFNDIDYDYDLITSKIAYQLQYVGFTPEALFLFIRLYGNKTDIIPSWILDDFLVFNFNIIFTYSKIFIDTIFGLFINNANETGIELFFNKLIESFKVYDETFYYNLKYLINNYFSKKVSKEKVDEYDAILENKKKRLTENIIRKYIISKIL